LTPQIPQSKSRQIANRLFRHNYLLKLIVI
jgi:hypothetical protein